MERVRDQIRLVSLIDEIICKEAISAAANKYENVAKIEELAPKAEKILAEAGCNFGASLHTFTSNWKITKACIASILLMVYETRITGTKSNKD